MKQLSGLDNVFLRLERGNQFMHVAALGIYDPSSAPGGKVRFKDILAFFEARLDVAPIFRQRLVTVPMDLDRPYWVEDDHVDVEFHVRHLALPHPGDWRQLCIQVARLHSRPLDRSKPLWEAYVIEGLNNIPGVPPGSFAFYIKFHHAAIDGEGGAAVLKAIHSSAPDESPVASPRQPRERDREPTAVELYARALASSAQRVPKVARLTVQTARRLAGAGKGQFEKLKATLQESGLPGVETLKGKLQRPPETRFSGKVSAHRVIELVGLPMAEIKRVRQHVDGASVNDIFLTVVGGALNQYLASKGELPDRTMTAQIPMTVRGDDKSSEVGNQIGVTVMPVHSEIADPLARLAAIRAGAARAKALVSVVGRDLTGNVYDALPALVSELVTTKVMLPTMNIIVSNVRGPDGPIYLAGARMCIFAPISIVIDGLGLNVTGFSYHGTLWLCAVACREMMPDPGFFADCLRTSFADLAQVAAKPAGATGRRQAATHRRRKRP